MPEKIVDAPVGVRYRTQNTTNRASDQDIILDLLTSIPDKDGGKAESWPAKPLSGPNGTCPQLLQDAIWDFQTHWKKRGVFHNIDGVCDPFGHTANHMKALQRGRLGVDPVPPAPDVKPLPTPPRIAGTWQVTNMWSVQLGEGGVFGAIQMEITQPDGQKFHINALGAGLGAGVDLGNILKVLKGGGALFEASAIAIKTLAESLAKGVLFNIGDWLQLGLGNMPLSTTAGVLVPNPINEYIGNATTLSRYILCGGSAPPPILIANAGGGVAAGMEGGVIFMGRNPLVTMPFTATAMGVYGSSGLNMKFGIGVAGMVYSITSVRDGPGNPKFL